MIYSSGLKYSCLWIISIICFTLLFLLLGYFIGLLFLNPHLAIPVLLELSKYVAGGVLGFLISDKVKN